MAVVLVVAGVGLHVHYQRILVGERLAAEFTLMFHGLEVRIVDPQVTHQSVIVGERLVAGGAYVLLGAVLHVHVPMKLRVGEEALVADLAMSRVLFEVTSMMSGQLRGLHERATTHVANEVPLVRVDPSVYRQGVRPLEGLAANVALIRTSVAMRHQVALKQILRSEKLRTNVTLVKRLSGGGLFLRMTLTSDFSIRDLIKLLLRQ